MSFDKLNILLISIFTIVIYFIYLYRYESHFFEKVRKYWFFGKSRIRKFSTFIYFVAFLVFAISLGDLRGQEVSVESNIPFQKTVVLIDTSQSMLVEDIRPNRIGKASLIARHFIRNSFGHQVSLSVFSDIQRKIVPFTDDIEILESRLQTLLSSSPEGGSNISLAIKEAAQYFKTKEGFAAGNILLITDGEEHDGIDVSLPEKISLAVVAVGSEKGGRIPLRRKSGELSRFKKHDGNEVVSKVKKSFFENLVSSQKNAKTWYAQSYSLPTQEILGFFEKNHKNIFTKGSMKQKPVKGYFLIMIAIIFYCLSVLLTRFRSFAPLLIIFTALTYQESSMATELEGLMNKFKQGEITKKEKLRIAELLMKDKKYEKSSKVYSSTLKRLEKENVNDLFNYGTSLIRSKKIKEGIEIYKYLKDEREISDQMNETIKKHIQLAFKKNKGKGKGKNNKDDKNKQDKKDQKGKNNKDQKGNNKKKSKPKDGKDDKKKKEDKNSDDGKPKEDDQKKKKKKQKQNKNWEDLKNKTKKKKRTTPVKGVLKQIMNDDGNLQKKFLNTSSKDRSNSRKDW